MTEANEQLTGSQAITRSRMENLQRYTPEHDQQNNRPVDLLVRAESLLYYAKQLAWGNSRRDAIDATLDMLGTMDDEWDPPEDLMAALALGGAITAAAYDVVQWRRGIGMGVNDEPTRRPLTDPAQEFIPFPTPFDNA